MKKLKNNFITIMFIMLFSINIFAQNYAPVPEEQCKNNAQNLIRQNDMFKNIWSIKSREDIIDDSGYVNGHIYHLLPKGYIIVSNIEKKQAIKAFSFQHNFKHDKTSFMNICTVNALKSSIMVNKIIDKVERKKIEEEEQIKTGKGHKEWSPISIDPSIYMNEEIIEQVYPLITAKWGQLYPFNVKLNKYIEDRVKDPRLKGGGYHIGCVATALAQVFYKFRYPKQPHGVFKKYTVAGTGIFTGNIINEFVWYTSNLDDHSYDWDNILDLYNQKRSSVRDLTPKEESAISTFMFDMGIIICHGFGKDYTSGGIDMLFHKPSISNVLGASGGGYNIIRGDKVQDGKEMFGYNYCNIGYIAGSRNYDSPSKYELPQNKDFIPIIIEHLKNGVPVLLGGFRHMAVIDGYSKTKSGKYYFHINWGWEQTGYIDIEHEMLIQEDWYIPGYARKNEMLRRGHEYYFDFYPVDYKKPNDVDFSYSAGYDENFFYKNDNLSLNWKSDNNVSFYEVYQMEYGKETKMLKIGTIQNNKANYKYNVSNTKYKKNIYYCVVAIKEVDTHWGKAQWKSLFNFKKQPNN